MRRPGSRCLKCRNPPDSCKCAEVTSLSLRTRVEVILHVRELKKRAATGPFCLTALKNSRLHLHGRREAPLDLAYLHAEDRRLLLLHSGEDAVPLTPALLKEDPRPVTLIVPDGTRRQISRAARRIPGLERAERVSLIDMHRTTFAAIASALGIIEAPEVESQLLDLFSTAQDIPDDNAAETNTSSPLTILHEDEHLAIVNKPPGMLVHHGWARDETPALQLLRDQIGQRLFPVHRLDRATSGALVFAKRPEVARDLKALFDAHEVTKKYLALCRGHEFESKRVDHALKSPEDGVARSAVTDLRLLGAFERYGLVEAVPKTGRTHQVRKHLKHVSHPIIGDVRYGKGDHNRIFRERFGFHRLALHCIGIGFSHPRSRAYLQVHAPLSLDFQTLLSDLGLGDLVPTHVNP